MDRLPNLILRLFLQLMMKGFLQKQSNQKYKMNHRYKRSANRYNSLQIIQTLNLLKYNRIHAEK